MASSSRQHIRAQSLSILSPSSSFAPIVQLIPPTPLPDSFNFSISPKSINGSETISRLATASDLFSLSESSRPAFNSRSTQSTNSESCCSCKRDSRSDKVGKIEKVEKVEKVEHFENRVEVLKNTVEGEWDIPMPTSNARSMHHRSHSVPLSIVSNKDENRNHHYPIRKVPLHRAKSSTDMMKPSSPLSSPPLVPINPIVSTKARMDQDINGTHRKQIEIGRERNEEVVIVGEIGRDEV